MRSESTEVLVVGAGPSGLTAAVLLALCDVPFRIVDREVRPSDNSRAAGIQSRSLEIFEQMGVVEAFLERGRAATGLDLHLPYGRIRVDLFGEGVFPSRYPHVLLLEQSATERLLLERLAELGHEVEWGCEVLDPRAESGGVRVRMRSGDGPERQLRARWAIAADGADSTLRAALELPFTGSTYEQRYVVADVRVAAGKLDASRPNLNFNDTGFLLLVPLTAKSVFRLATNYPPGFSGSDEDPTFDDVRRHVDRVFPGGLQVDDPEWFSTFRFHSRCVEEFRQGPVFLVGDAAHVHSPVGGQGMNTGIQDAHALVWRLAQVRQGRLPAKALDTYEMERLPVARGIVRTTDALFRLVDHPGALARWLRMHVLPRLALYATRIAPLRRRLARRVAQVAIRYRHGLLVPSGEGLPRGFPAAGERFPHLSFHRGGETRTTPALLDYRRHHLLLVAGTADDARRAVETARALAAALPEILSCHPVRVGGDAHGDTDLWHCDPPATARPRVGAGAACLVRPDGYVAVASPSLDAEALEARIRAYLGGEGWAPT